MALIVAMHKYNGKRTDSLDERVGMEDFYTKAIMKQKRFPSYNQGILSCTKAQYLPTPEWVE